MTPIEEIAAERKRQIQVEGWSAEHDDRHQFGELRKAASCYAAWAGTNWKERFGASGASTPHGWPWSKEWWKPGDQRRDLIKAAALIVAEIERLDRAAEKEGRRLSA